MGKCLDCDKVCEGREIDLVHAYYPVHCKVCGIELKDREAYYHVRCPGSSSSVTKCPICAGVNGELSFKKDMQDFINRIRGLYED